MDDKIRRRVVTVNGQRIRYTYNVRNREVTVPGVPPFEATCWDAAPDEVREALARDRP